VTGLQWFKIYQDGFNPSTNTWAVDTLIANKGKVSFKIPACIASGQYLLRHEIIGENFELDARVNIELK
jgi:lytic cellulose monooxygenase (C4-dehydrogenating)